MKEVSNVCSACGAVIGPNYIEQTLYPVGEFGLCGWCYKKMLERGRIELLERVETRGVTYLYPDGTTVNEKRRR